MKEVEAEKRELTPPAYLVPPNRACSPHPNQSQLTPTCPSYRLHPYLSVQTTTSLLLLLPSLSISLSHETLIFTLVMHDTRG